MKTQLEAHTVIDAASDGDYKQPCGERDAEPKHAPAPSEACTLMAFYADYSS